MNTKLAHKSLALIGLSVLLATPGAQSQEKKMSVKTKLAQTETYILKTTKTKKDVVNNDKDLIARQFDNSGNLITDVEPDSEQGKLVASLKKKREKDKGFSALVALSDLWIGLRVYNLKKHPPNRPITLALLRQGVDELVKLNIQSDPAGASIYLKHRDRFIGKTNLKHWVSPGKLTVYLTLKDYEAYEEEIEVSDTNDSINAKLKKKK